jgi:hypothetical protein
MAAPLASLLDALGQIDDPRKARGIRHPFTSILALTVSVHQCCRGLGIPISGRAGTLANGSPLVLLITIPGFHPLHSG